MLDDYNYTDSVKYIIVGCDKWFRLQKIGSRFDLPVKISINYFQTQFWR